MPTENTTSDRSPSNAPGVPDDLVRTLRRFHLRGERDNVLTAPADGTYPALLSGMRQPDAVRHDFPIFLADGDGPDVDAVPVAALIDDGLDRAGLSAENARVLHDNRLRLERAIRRRASRSAGLVDASTLFDEAGTALRSELGLTEPHDSSLDADYRTLRAAWPESGWFLDLDADAALRAFVIVAAHEQRVRWARFDARARELVVKLTSIVEVERAKDAEHREGDAIAGAIGGAAQYVNPAAFSETLGQWRGSQRMDPVERTRVELALSTLETHLSRSGRSSLVIVYESGEPEGLPAELGVEWVRSDEPLTAAETEFDRWAARVAEVFVAARIAELEVAHRYRPEQHDAWLDAFGWRRFSADERRLVPPVVALETAWRLAGDRLASYSRALRSSRPIHVMTTVAPAAHPGDDAGTESRLDLGYMAIAHRDVFVHQCSIASPVSMCEGFRDAIRSAAPAVHVVDPGTGLDTPPLGVWLHAASALEGRAHPVFRYDPTGGETWAERFDLGGNPEPEMDWPTYSMPDHEDLSLAFTFADYALLESRFAGAFAVIPDAVPDDALVPLAEHLNEAPDEAPSGVPFVIAADAEGRTVRLAVTRELALEARARHDFWRTLQEFGGIHNAYAESAAARARTEAEAVAAADRARLEREHASDLDRVRRDAAGLAMQGLARMLLGLDPGGLATGSITAASTTAPPPVGSPGAAAPPAPDSAPPAAPDAVDAGATPADASAAGESEADEDDDALVFEEAWINTPLCTSCNDCTAINPKLFVYDQNKQAHIGDIHAGTYSQLVQAAEKCPARCIHPGQPVNPDEPGLEELVARAAPFNQ